MSIHNFLTESTQKTQSIIDLESIHVYKKCNILYYS